MQSRPQVAPPQAQTRTQIRTQARTQTQTRNPPVRSDSLQSLRGNKRKKQSRESSTAPRPPPPPIHLPDPTTRPPPHFLRNQQALLGLAGLIGRVHPATLATQRSARGSNPSNPIVVDDGTNPSPIGRRQSTVDFSKLPPPSNEEVVASLIRDKNVYPVLESILKFIATTKTSISTPTSTSAPTLTQTQTSQNSPDRRDDVQEQPNGKRRRVDTVPADAANWDVPLDGGAPVGEWEKERGKQLIAQLVRLIKAAARKAALKSYQQQARQRQQSNSHSQQQQPRQVKDDEPKIRGHYRPRTALYGRPPGAPIPEVLVDQSNTTGVGVPTPITPSCEPQLSAHPVLQVPLVEPASKPSNSFGELLPLLPTVPLNLPGDDSQNVSEWSGGTSTPSESSMMQDFDQNIFDRWMSILNAFPNPQSNDGDNQLSSVFCYDVDQFMSSFSDHFDPSANLLPPSASASAFDNFTLSGIADDFNNVSSFVNTNSDFAMDPVLLAMSMPASSAQSPLHFDSMPPVPALVTSPVESTGSSADLLTPHINMDTVFNEPGVFTDRQDPLAAAGALLQHAPMTTPSSNMFNTLTPCTPASPIPIPVPVPPSSTPETPQQSRTRRTTPISRASTEAPAAPKIPTKNPIIPEWPVRPMRALNKQDILSRARERRRQLVGEIDRAKVELWETTIEQGVLAHLVKEKL